MNEIPTIITERVDDIPLLLEQMQRMGLPTLLDTHFPTHGNWTGLSLGWVSTIWLSSIGSRGDHRMVHVEPWVAKRLWTRGVTTGQAVTRVDCVGLDTSMDPGLAARQIDPRTALQGNLDPILLLTGGAALEREVKRILDGLGKGRFVFNLGHGILPETPIAHVERLLELVRKGPG